MSHETRYKLTALVFFFVLFTGYFMQFVHPYVLVKEPVDSFGAQTFPGLRNNVFILPVTIAAAVIFAVQCRFYITVKEQVRILPLIGSFALLALLFTVHFLNSAQHLDADTRHKIIEYLGGYG